jgi:hypothetical protein
MTFAWMFFGLSVAFDQSTTPGLIFSMRCSSSRPSRTSEPRSETC